jgi:hypothetical protein
MALRVRYNKDTGAITSVGRPGRDFKVYEFDVTPEQLVGATVERYRRGGWNEGAQIRLADDTILTETWPPPASNWDE